MKSEEPPTSDIIDLLKDTTIIHSKIGNMTKDMNYAIRNEQEDKFIRKHIQILEHVDKYLDKAKVRKANSVLHEDYQMTEDELKEKETEFSMTKEKALTMLWSDINVMNAICRNKRGEYFKMLMSILAKRTAESEAAEKEKSILERVPLLGKLLSKTEDET